MTIPTGGPHTLHMTIPIRGPSSPQLAPVLYPLEEHTVVFTSRLVLRAHVAVGIHRKLTPVATCVQSCTYIHPYIHTYELSAHVNCQLVLQVILFLISVCPLTDMDEGLQSVEPFIEYWFCFFVCSRCTASHVRPLATRTLWSSTDR